jgi:hypothetical protein
MCLFLSTSSFCFERYGTYKILFFHGAYGSKKWTVNQFYSESDTSRIQFKDSDGRSIILSGNYIIYGIKEVAK